MTTQPASEIDKQVRELNAATQMFEVVAWMPHIQWSALCLLFVSHFWAVHLFKKKSMMSNRMEFSAITTHAKARRLVGIAPKEMGTKSTKS